VFDGAALALAKQEALLAAASWLFNLKGVDATSLDEIAARVGVTKKVIYHNIGGKSVLLAACYRRSLAFATSLIERTRQRAPSPLHAFCMVVHAHAEARLREDIAPLSGPGGLEFLPPDAALAVNNASERLYAAAEILYTAGRRANSLRQLNTGALLMIMPGLVEWIPKWLRANSPEECRVIAHELGAFCAFGLRPVGAAGGSDELRVSADVVDEGVQLIVDAARGRP
jgi:AcrR family transcriptional regulator